MGFLDFLFDKEKAAKRNVAKHRKKLTNMYVQPSERRYLIHALREVGTEDAVEALLARFDEQAPNTTVDVEEKEYVYDTLVVMSRESDVDIVTMVRDHIIGAEENINWPMKTLDDLLSHDQMIDFLVELLSACTIDYARSTEKKQELILRAADMLDGDDDEALRPLAEEVARFLEDADETIRFLAVDALLKSEFDDYVGEQLLPRFFEEDSIRILQQLTEAFAGRRDWVIPEDRREDVEEVLPDSHGVHKDGHIYEHRI
jgi:hypothetical protein